MAIAAPATLRTDLGLRVPQDLSVVGFDNVPQVAWPSFDLTTMQQDVDRMVEATRTLLFEQINGECWRSVIVPCVLMERGTMQQRGDRE